MVISLLVSINFSNLMNYRPHAAHSSHSFDADGNETALEDFPSRRLHPESEQVRLLLEELDDVVFQAIRGDANSLAQAQQLWPRVIHEIGWDLVEESREQYLRYAVDVMRNVEPDRKHQPEHAIAALEVIELLTGE
ncbi:hypothetical protein [Bythopirellula polymerisocia]|uniref:Uncharacterized protein n=1 Tax=Bythopirellula polymerisocia TaxID=2528003 RepID=A0A5C6CYB2_9BACT|nr:hypothetical protein [Bythopirellula polymerisocia]TWU28564.1 hypothetical protein Pla144_18550 [Bythopirellula polymerisocia]